MACLSFMSEDSDEIKTEHINAYFEVDKSSIYFVFNNELLGLTKDDQLRVWQIDKYMHNFVIYINTPLITCNLYNAKGWTKTDHKDNNWIEEMIDQPFHSYW